MIRFEEAQERLLSGVRPLGAERVPVDHCVGRVLAEEVIAGFDMPAFDHTSMDGYAFAGADFVAADADRAGAPTGAGPWEFPVRGESAAGGALPSFERGTACRIFTGARLPIAVDYYQGPRFHIALMVLWRKLPDANASSLADSACGLSGNDRFFNSNQSPSVPSQTYLDLLSRGWSVVAPQNFLLPLNSPMNPCNGTNPPPAS